MLKQLSVENFTVFSEANFEFAPGLNVIVGENGTGKSHVLKLAYSILAESETFAKLPSPPEMTLKLLRHTYTAKLRNVFRADRLGQFLRRNAHRDSQGHNVSESVNNQELSVSFFFVDSSLDCHFQYSDSSETVTKIDVLEAGVLPKRWVVDKAVFIPPRELLSIYPGFVSLYEARYLEFEETYRDTCLLLGEPLLKQPMVDLMSVLEEAMGGKVKLDNGRFYLVTPEQGKLEITLVAEGLRKLAMLAQLVAVGALEKDGYLFWDEPEANLNPRLVKVVARVICDLVSRGVQVFVATHSYFLLKEIQIISGKQQHIDPRYFSLLKNDDGVEVESAGSLDDLQSIVTLEEELAQFDREQEAHNA